VKRIPKSFNIAQQGINLVEKIVLEMNFIWNPRGPIEAGIDGIIEVCDPNTGAALNSIVQVQSKATSGPFTAETNNNFEYICKEDDLDYWLSGNVPVILVVSRPVSNEAYWVSINDYFANLEKRATRKINFDKNLNKFTPHCRSELMQLAVPKNLGVYFSPLLHNETVYSNLLEVKDFARRLFIADTPFRSIPELWAELIRLGGTNVGGEWILKEERIFSFHDLTEYPWNKISDSGTIEEFDTAEWAFSNDDDKRRDFVRLLNQALREKIKSDLNYNKKRGCYYFKPTSDLSDHRITYQTLGRKRSRVLFRGFASKRNPEWMAFYRHSAFIGKFHLYNDKYYLEISPTYYFTHDGYRVSRYFEERLSGIKRLEKNPNVFAQLLMWAWFLSNPGDMFSTKYPFLEFGALQSFEIRVGIDDKTWIGSEEEAYAKSIESSLGDLPLFKTLYSGNES